MIVIWQCSDIEQRWAQAISDEQRDAHFLAIDLAIEAELNPPTEVADIERVPVECAPVLGNRAAHT